MIKEPIFQIVLIVLVLCVFWYFSSGTMSGGTGSPGGTKGRNQGSSTTTSLDPYFYDESNSGFPYTDDEWTQMENPTVRMERMAPVVLNDESYRDRKEGMAPVALGDESFRSLEAMDDGEYSYPADGVNGSMDDGWNPEGFSNGVEHLTNISIPQDENIMRQNFLQATGIDRVGNITVNQPKRFLSNDLRKAHPNPRTQQVLWNGSTVEADTMRRALDEVS